MMNMGMTQGGGDAEQPGMAPEQTENKVTIEKMPDGTYQVEQGADQEQEPTPEPTNEPGAQTFRTSMEACKAAIALLDGGGDKEAEAAFASNYSSDKPKPKMGMM